MKRPEDASVPADGTENHMMWVWAYPMDANGAIRCDQAIWNFTDIAPRDIIRIEQAEEKEARVQTRLHVKNPAGKITVYHLPDTLDALIEQSPKAAGRLRAVAANPVPAIQPLTPQRPIQQQTGLQALRTRVQNRWIRKPS